MLTKKFGNDYLGVKAEIRNNLTSFEQRRITGLGATWGQGNTIYTEIKLKSLILAQIER